MRSAVPDMFAGNFSVLPQAPEPEILLRLVAAEEVPDLIRLRARLGFEIPGSLMILGQLQVPQVDDVGPQAELKPVAQAERNGRPAALPSGPGGHDHPLLEHPPRRAGKRRHRSKNPVPVITM